MFYFKIPCKNQILPMKISRMERGRKHQQRMNRMFIPQEWKWKLFKIKAVCDIFYRELAMQFQVKKKNNGNYNGFNKLHLESQISKPP